MSDKSSTVLSVMTISLILLKFVGFCFSLSALPSATAVSFSCWRLREGINSSPTEAMNFGVNHAGFVRSHSAQLSRM